MPIKFTKPEIDRLKPQDKLYCVWDADIKGLGVRVPSTNREGARPFRACHHCTLRTFAR